MIFVPLLCHSQVINMLVPIGQKFKSLIINVSNFPISRDLLMRPFVLMSITLQQQSYNVEGFFISTTKTV